MNYGMDQLTGDQLLELLQEACLEFGNRDPYLQRLAQQTITTQAENLKLRRAAGKEAVTTVHGAHVAEIKLEALTAVREGVRDGTVRLLTPAQEARAVVDGTLEAKIKLIDETVAAIQGGFLAKPKEPDWSQDWNATRLGAYDLYQKRYAEALVAHQEAMQTAPPWIGSFAPLTGTGTAIPTPVIQQPQPPPAPPIMPMPTITLQRPPRAPFIRWNGSRQKPKTP